MIYLDTSFLVPVFRLELSSAAVIRYMSALPADGFAISLWTRVEFASMVARDVRMGHTDAMSGRQQIDEFGRMQDESLEVWPVAAADLDLAHAFICDFSTKLRGPDALHLAIAKNRGADYVLTLDEGMLFAAKKLRLKARRGIRR